MVQECQEERVSMGCSRHLRLTRAQPKLHTVVGHRGCVDYTMHAMLAYP